MTFYDKVLKTNIMVTKINEEYIANVNDEIFSLPIDNAWVKDYPEWIIQDIIQILVRKQIRKQGLNQLASSIIKKES